MKKIILSLCLVAIGGICLAQKVYFKLSGGYGLPVATQDVGTNYFYNYNNQTQESDSKIENVSASYGAGMNFSGGAGFMFSKNLGFDLTVQYLIGKKYEITQRESYTGQGKEESIETRRGRAVFFNPSLLVSPGPKLPYARVGVVIGSPKVKSEESYYYDLDGTNTQETESVYRKGTAFGIQGAIGYNFMISNNIDIFVEANFIGMTYYPKENEVTKYMNDGTDNLADLSERQKRTEFKKEIDLQGEPSNDEPSQQLKLAMPFSSVGINFGVKFIVGGRATE
jgi:hypothetical protein